LNGRKLHDDDFKAQRHKGTIFAVLLFLFLSTISITYAQNSYYPDGKILRSSGGIIYYPNGATAQSSGGIVYYPDGGTLKSSGGMLNYPGGKALRSSGGILYYPGGSILRSSGGLVYYSNGNTARTSGGTIYYENGNIAEAPVSIKIDIGCGYGTLMLRVSKDRSEGLLILFLGFERVLCIDIDSGHCEIQ
jgi:hypothetical protein